MIAKINQELFPIEEETRSNRKSETRSITTLETAIEQIIEAHKIEGETIE